MKLDEAYFGITLINHSGPTNGPTQFETYNIFDNIEVRRSICIYKVRKIQVDDPLFFCFNSFWSRSQYEFYISDGYRDIVKKDAYSLFIEPNEEYLMKVVDIINLNDCKKWLKENEYGE